MPYYTGTKTVLTLRKYIDGQPTDDTKANSPSDPDYIPPFEDTSACPIEIYTTTTSTSTTTTTTTAAPSSSLTMWRSTTGGGYNPPTGWATSSLACSSVANATTVYFNQNVTGWDDVVSNSLIVYVDGGANVPYQGQSTFFRSAQTAGTGKTFQLSNAGVISSYVTCLTTTTTTTTSTTTTTTAAPCNEWELEGGAGGAGLFQYTDCNGVVQQRSVEDGDSEQICSTNTPSLISGYGTMTFNGTC